MSRFATRSGVMILALALAPALMAIPIPFVNTGLNGVFSPTAGGDVDPDWIITQILNPNPAGAIPTNCPPNTASCSASIVTDSVVTTAGWLPNTGNDITQTGSRWIWVNPQAQPTGFGVTSPVQVLFHTEFTLPAGFEASTVVIQGRMASDDAVTQVSVNGVTVPGLNQAGFSAFGPLFTINLASFGGPNPFVAGTNRLYFLLNDNISVGGFRAELTGEYNFIPEPATWLLMGAGLVGFAAYRRRKARA